MDSVMINQLPELVIPRNRTFTTVNKATTPHYMEKRNPYISKWYVLFDNKNDQWISFKPKPGQNVYPCYACRDMFGGRESFLDHVNRRGLLLKYRCGLCRKNLIFYNTCSFLLHTRDHFTEHSGKIDLDYVEISSIPMEIAGFLPISNIPRLYDKEDVADNENIVRSIKFYKPFPNCAGKRVVHFQPFDLLFFPSANEGNSNPNFKEAMVIRQVNDSIPKCVFVLIKTTNDVPKNNVTQPVHDSEESGSDSDIVCLDEDSNSNTPFTQKIQVKSLNSMIRQQNESDSDSESLLEEQKSPHICHECGSHVKSLSNHFQVGNKPFMDQLKCKKCGLISTSACSLKAHLRIHDKGAPFVCPECGQLFKTWDELNNHMEFKCFHTAKTVRFKCPAKKCGKIFAQTITFSSHFPFAHIQVRSVCSVCNKYFPSDLEYEKHTIVEGHRQPPENSVLKIHECTVCQCPADDIKKHVLNHVQNRNNRIYVFICKYCRSYYRSKQTYGVHLLKCSKLLLNNQVKKEVLRIDTHNDLKCKVIKYCKPCHCKIQFHCAYKDIKKVASCCPRCSTPFADGFADSFADSYADCPANALEYTTNPYVRKNTDTCNFVCILCNEILGRAYNLHDYTKHLCKYKNAVVIVNVDCDIARFDTSPSTSTSTSTTSTCTSASTSTSDSNKKKRKRLLQTPAFKKRISSEPDEILPSEPIIFDGEYKCRLCTFSHESRKTFHEHIQEHRDVSTSYQCMECGECFVVKPSLLKHLQVFHLIEDLELYMNQNECFDKEAVRLLEENMRMVPGEVNEPVAENQCRVCRQFFSDTQELSKHFRVHGMAFLMKKIK